MPYAKKSLRASLLLLSLAIPLSQNLSSGAFHRFSPAPASRAMKTATDLNDILRYISSGWDHLTRSLTDCHTFADSKTVQAPTLYLPADFDAPAGWRELQKRCGVRVERLPGKITGLGEIDLTKIHAHGLLYLGNPYVVPGGLAMSLHESEAQWDYPYGWAPVHLLAVEGLRRYGYNAEANRIAYKFLSMVFENFQSTRTIREKYNVVTRSLVTHIEAGYSRNVIGFGWTNGVFLELLHDLPAEFCARLGTEQSKPLEGDSKQ